MRGNDPDSFAGRISELERWREREAEPALSELHKHLTAVADEQRIAAGVADELRRRGIQTSPTQASVERTAQRVTEKIEERGITPTLALTFWQKLGGFVAGALLLADAVRGLVS